MTEEERRTILADEWLIVRDSGEIPEITFHASIHYLTEDAEGPRFSLEKQELSELKNAALLRYQEMILRDITLENYHKSFYRGVKRTLYNWKRYKAFLQRQSLEDHHFHKQVAEIFLQYLVQGVALSGSDLPERFVNCSAAELAELMREIGVEPQQVAVNIMHYCLKDC